MSQIMAMAGATASPAATFCKDYIGFLFWAGQWTLGASILLGIALAAATVVMTLRKPVAVAAPRGGPAPVAALDAIKGFIQALSSAPTWLALFGGGLLLLWMAGHMMPEICPAAKSEQTKGSAANTATRGTAT